MSTNADLGFSLKETLARLEAKVDDVVETLGSLRVTVAGLSTRVEGLEKAGDRRWSLIPTWIATAAAFVLALVPYLLHGTP